MRTCTTPSGETVTTYSINFVELPGYTTPDVGGDRRRIFNPDGQYVGTVVYVSRRLHDARIGTEYGWRTASGRKLTTLADAVRRLTTPR